MFRIILRLAQLETPKRVIDLFLVLMKDYSISIKICSLVEDGVYTVNASCGDVLLKNWILYFFILAITFLVSNFYHKM